MNGDLKVTLPANWTWTTIGNVCFHPQYGWTTSATNEGSLHLLRTTDITKKDIDWNTVPFCKKNPPEPEKYLLRDGDIVVSRAGSVGYSKRIRNPKEAVFASYLIRFKPLISERYLSYFLQSPYYWNSIAEKSLGIALSNVNASKLKEIFLPLAPLAEQERIVGKIEELFTRLDAGGDNLKQVKALLMRYRHSVLQNAFDAELTPDWQRRQLAEVCEDIIDNLHSTPKYDGNNFYCIRSQDVGYGEIDYSAAKKISIEEFAERTRRGEPRAGDIVYVREGEVGRCAIVDGSERLSLGQRVMLFRPNLSVTRSKFLLYQLLSPQVHQKQVLSYITGTTVRHVNIRDLKNVWLRIPSLFEQDKIVEAIDLRLSTAEELLRTAGWTLRKTDRLRQSILRIAFEGRLVTQNPKDEPADKLLERVKEVKRKKGIRNYPLTRRVWQQTELKRYAE